jgi:PPOX class probable F420-dependent enzyme
MDSGRSRACFAVEPVARLATADEEGRPHVVPIVFVVLDDALYFAVDAKPKAALAGPLRRLDNIRANPRASVLVDRYDEDWRRLWWARADGTARILADGDPRVAPAMAALTGRYPQYRTTALRGPVVEIAVDRWSGWAADASTVPT